MKCVPNVYVIYINICHSNNYLCKSSILQAVILIM